MSSTGVAGTGEGRRGGNLVEDAMADVVVLGAGLSGALMAYELIPQLRREDRLTVIGQGPRYHFVPSNPWVAVGWREREATWNAVCLADFGDGGVAFAAEPEIPPRNVNWSSKGQWVHYAKIAFEKYFLRKVRRGESEPFYERVVLDRLGIRKIKESSACQPVPHSNDGRIGPALTPGTCHRLVALD
jgi:hypothetical protein